MALIGHESHRTTLGHVVRLDNSNDTTEREWRDQPDDAGCNRQHLHATDDKPEHLTQN